MPDNKSFIKMPISDNVLNPQYQKYNDVHKLDGVQHNPNEVKTMNFKQDYMVIIRKKLFYAATAQVGGDENYLRIYQVNNFNNIRISQNVFGRPGSCSVTIKGAERVISADKPSTINTEGWSDWKTMMKSWLNIDETNEAAQTGKANWEIGSQGNGVNFGNLFKSREAQYGWKYAEKCDWEPMDEIWVFGKTRNEKYRDPVTNEYRFLPLFFGYLDTITKTFQAGKGGLFISIQASDHLKLLDLGKVVNSPTLTPGMGSGGGLDVRFDTDEFGCFIINEPYVNARGKGDEKDPNLAPYLYDNVFGGKPPYEIINSLAVNSGIPKQYLTKRIEKIKSIPFLIKIKGGNGDFFTADLKNRLDVCRQAAEKLYLEFFADEEGNIVLKVPNYALGANRLPNNNMGHIFEQDLLDSVGFRLEQEGGTNADTPTKKPTIPLPTPTYANITSWPNMKNGASGESVKKLQKMLKCLGYTMNSIDGIFGSNTESSVKAFQKEYGLSPDGIVGTLTKEKLNTCITNVTIGWSDLSSGNTGTNVLKLQRLMNSLGKLSGGIDSIFGINTKAAVKSFQTSQGIKIDGIVGVETRTAINSQISSLITSTALKSISISTDNGGLYNMPLVTKSNATGRDKVIPPPTKVTVTAKVATTTKPTTSVSNSVVYTVLKNDTLWGIAKKILGDGNRWPEIYNSNRSIIGKNPNIIIPGTKLTIYKSNTQSTSTPAVTIPKKQTTNAPTPQQEAKKAISPPKYKVVKGETLSQKTDKYIPEILPEHIISFTLIDTDKEIYNMFEVQIESNIVDLNNSTVPLRRAVPDLDSIMRFGLRPAPGVVNTPLISNPIEAELFGIMMTTKSLSNRYSGSLSMIEDSSIKVGDPVRFFMYDEHPMKETGLFPGEKNQTVFYATGIERSINPDQVSTMSLQLVAGRVMGQESIYDICLPFYKFYYDEKIQVQFSEALNDYTKFYLNGKRYFEYTVKMQDTLQKIIDKNYDGYYGDINPDRYEEISYAIVGLNANVFGSASTSINFQQIDEHLYNGLILKLPNKNALRK
jgi:peptidoglycan hydrolase-like protein with peptidoglycan-binding domain